MRLGARNPAGGVAAHRVIEMRSILGTWLIGLVLLFPCQSAGQGHFRITYTPRTEGATAVTLDGRVFNDADHDVRDVWVTAEGLDASGKVLAAGITFAGFLIPGRGSVTFVAKLPAAAGIQSYRLAVTSYRDAAAVQSP
jgi:hypothetical protein